MTNSVFSFTAETDPFETRELCTQARKFAESTLKVSPGDTPVFRRDDFDAMGTLGLCGMSVSEDCGGSNLTDLDIAAVLFELARVQLGPAVYLSVHAMASRILAAQPIHKKLVGELASGTKLGAFCLTEPAAGSDAGSIQTRAEKTTGGYEITGEKIYITSGGVADVYVVFARTGGPGPSGISAFAVERGASGMSFGRPEKKMGCEGAPICSVHFERCAVAESSLLGAEGEGFRIALSGLNGGRINIAASACGVASRALELATAYLGGREQFGKRLSDFQGLQFLVADLAVALRASILLTRDAATGTEKGQSASAAAAMAKCFATDAAMRITTDAVQLFGGAGYLAEYEVERLMRDAKMLQIVEGTNQIQRMLIARAILGT